jgi:hypothetical protein
MIAGGGMHLTWSISGRFFHLHHDGDFLRSPGHLRFMLYRRFILIAKALPTLFLLLGVLHADRPPEPSPEPDSLLETIELSVTNVFEPGALDPAPLEEDPVAPSLDPARATDPPDIPDPAVDALPHAEEAAIAIAQPRELRLKNVASTEPEEQPTPLEAEVVPVQTASLPLRIDELETVTFRLAAIEGNLAGQHQRALDMVLSSNRTALVVGGLFAGVGVLGILMTALILARILNHLSNVVVTLPAGQAIGAPAMAWPGCETNHPVASKTIEQVSARFLGAIEQLEQRIHELERLPQPRLNQGQPGNGARQNATAPVGASIPDPTLTTGPTSDTDATILCEPPHSSASVSNQANERHQQVEALLVEGENLLQNDNLETALERFDTALSLEPRNADALIKRGMALERLQRLEAALESYDRAIASNAALTLAYLHKGAVCNRLQRYREALECYERALQSEHKS